MLHYHSVFYAPESHQKPGVRKCHSNRKDLRRGPRDCWGLLVAHSDWEEHQEGSLGEARKRGAAGWSNSRRKKVEKQKGFVCLSKGKR